MGITIKILFALLLVYKINGQIPSFGGCPDYQPMVDFNKEKFLGTWYEVERYFTVTEIGSKCVSAVYEKRQDDKIWVNNVITNSFTGVQRIISGVVTPKITKTGDATYNIRYNTRPVSYESTLHVLETDYDNFAVIWSCSGLGPFGHTESVWLMSRERVPPGPILQRAYGVLDKYKISRSFFVQTDQKDCVAAAPAVEAVDQPEVPIIKQKERPVLTANIQDSTNQVIEV